MACFSLTALLSFPGRRVQGWATALRTDPRVVSVQSTFWPTVWFLSPFSQVWLYMYLIPVPATAPELMTTQCNWLLRIGNRVIYDSLFLGSNSVCQSSNQKALSRWMNEWTRSEWILVALSHFKELVIVSNVQTNRKVFFEKIHILNESFHTC